MLVRGWESPVVSDGTIVADGGDGVNPEQSDDSEGKAPIEPKRMVAVDHLDTALEDTVTASTSSRSASAVIVALADRRAGSLAGFAGADEALAQELEPLFSTGALLDGGDTTYDDLSQELAAIVTRTSAVR